MKMKEFKEKLEKLMTECGVCLADFDDYNGNDEYVGTHYVFIKKDTGEIMPIEEVV